MSLKWRVVASLLIVFHLFAVGNCVLAAPSGPWATAEGQSVFTPPQFAFDFNNLVGPYLWALKLTHQRYVSNRPNLPGVAFEAKLFDSNGREISAMRFPDPDANIWVHYRQENLARWLADDQPVIPPMVEVIPAPAAAAPAVAIWQRRPGGHPGEPLKLNSVPLHLVPRDRPVYRPSPWSLLMARAYGRYLARAHGAEYAELTRYTQESIPPAVLFSDRPRSGPEVMAAEFGRSPQ